MWINRVNRGIRAPLFSRPKEIVKSRNRARLSMGAMSFRYRQISEFEFRSHHVVFQNRL